MGRKQTLIQYNRVADSRGRKDYTHFVFTTALYLRRNAQAVHPTRLLFPAR